MNPIYQRKQVELSRGRCYWLASVCVAIALATADSLHAEQPFFMGLGDLPGGEFFSQPWDISADGSVVTGVSRTAAVDRQAFRWTLETGMTALPGMTGANSMRISGDGSTIILSVPPSRWTAEMGTVVLPLASAKGVSPDGSTIVGHGIHPSTGANQARRFMQASGAEALFPDLASTIAFDLSADGSVILASEDNFGPFVWSADEGIVFLGGAHLTLPVTSGVISDNGNVVFGIVDENTPNVRAFRWTKERGILDFGTLPDGATPITARSASADGSIVVGNSGNRGYIWDESQGARYVDEVLVSEVGLGDELAGWALDSTLAVSADGRTLIGRGTNPAGNTEAWIAFLGAPVPEPSALALAILALAPIARRFRRVRHCHRPPA